MMKDFAGAVEEKQKKYSYTPPKHIYAHTYTLPYMHAWMYVCIRGRIKKRDKDSNQLIIIIYGS